MSALILLGGVLAQPSEVFALGAGGAPSPASPTISPPIPGPTVSPPIPGPIVSPPIPGPSAPPGGGQTTLINPLGNVTIEQFFLKIIDIVLVFAMPLIVVFIMIAGFKYVTANGNTEKIRSATTALTWAIVGGLLILGAKVLLTVISGTVAALQ